MSCPTLLRSLQLSGFVLPLINNALANATLDIPDITLDEHVPEPIGHITLTLSAIKVTKIYLGSLPFTLAPPNMVTTGLKGFNMQVNLDYAWRKVHWPHAKDHGTVTATPQGAAGVMTIKVDSNSSRPALDLVGSPSVSFDTFNIIFKGKVAWLYNLLMKSMKGKIATAISGAVSKALTGAITSLNKKFANETLLHKWGGGKSQTYIDTSFIGADATTNFLALGLRMDVLKPDMKTRCPLPTMAVPDTAPEGNNDLVQIIFGERFLDCVLATIDDDGALDFLIQPGSKIPIPLNTSLWKNLIPALSTKYPDRLMEMSASARIHPAAPCTKEKGFSIYYPLALDTLVLPPAGGSGAPTHVFTLGFNLTFGLNLHVVEKPVGNATVFANVTAVDVTVDAYDSAIGTIATGPLQILTSAISFAVKALLEKAFASGFPVPHVGPLHLTNVGITFADGYAALAASLGWI